MSSSMFCLRLSLLICLGGCASTYTPPPARTSRFPAPVDKPAAAGSTRLTTGSPQISGDPAVVTADGQELTDVDKLTLLWQKRMQQKADSKYPIGPGDVLEISVAGLEEITQRAVRVTGEGMISLPFVGGVRAGGLTEEEIKEEIRRRLEEYMYDPQVNLFVQEYRSRQVAVIGAVKKPGLYMLASGADTLLDVLTLAGGLLGDASPRIILMPAEPAEGGKAQESVSALPAQLVGLMGTSFLVSTVLKRGEAITIDLTGFAKGVNPVFLSLPARSGDVVLVPAGGDVLVEGWVLKPGPYKFTPGLTLVGAVAAAGGSRFAADNTSVRIIRTSKTGEAIILLADLGQIKQGEHPDVPLQEDDVIEVSYSIPKLLPYGVVRFFQNVFNVGAFASLPLF